MNTNNSVPGMMYPTTKGMVGSNPADSARLMAINKAELQTNANKLLSGGTIERKRLRKHGIGGGQTGIVVPQYQMLYEPQGGNGTNPNNQIQGNLQVSTQMSSNSIYDNQATKMGGSRIKKRSVCIKSKSNKRKSMKGKNKKTRKNHKKTRRNHKS